MAQTAAVRAVEALYQRLDEHVRELLPPGAGPEVDSALMLLTGGASPGTFGGVGVIGTGVAGVWSFDFQARITGWYIQEFDGQTGSIALNLARAQRGPAPVFVSIVGGAPPAISGGRYGEDAALVGWNDFIDRGDLIRVSVTSASDLTRVLFGLRIRRLEP